MGVRFLSKAQMKHLTILAICIAAYIIYFTLASFLRYDNFYTGRFDLGNMDQAVWNTINGRIFETSNINGDVISRLSTHADFLLILLSPFYLIWEHPKTLLLIQTFVLGFGAFFVYAIAKNVIKNNNLSLTLAIAYLLYPAMQYTNLYDFHAVTLAATFLLAAFYFLLKKKYIWLTIFLVLSGLTKEQVWITVALIGFYGFIVNKSKRVFFLALSLIFIFFFYYLVWHAIPNARGSQHFALSYFSEFGDSPTEIVKNIIASPQKIFTIMLTGNPLNYLKQLLYPLGLFSLLAPFFLIFALPDLLINLLSNNPQLHQIYYQYSAAITPFVFISAIYGVKNIKIWFPKIPNALVVCYLLIVACYSAYAFGPLPFSKSPNIDMFTKPQKNRVVIENFLSRVPEEYRVAATNNLGSHLSQRQRIATVPEGIYDSDIVLFLINNISKLSKDEKKAFESVMLNEDYKIAFHIGNFIVFEKR